MNSSLPIFVSRCPCHIPTGVVSPFKFHPPITRAGELTQKLEKNLFEFAKFWFTRGMKKTSNGLMKFSCNLHLIEHFIFDLETKGTCSSLLVQMLIHYQDAELIRLFRLGGDKTNRGFLREVRSEFIEHWNELEEIVQSGSLGNLSPPSNQ